MDVTALLRAATVTTLLLLITPVFSRDLRVGWQQLLCLTPALCLRVLQMTLSMQFSSVSTNMFLSPPGSLFYLLMATKWLRVAALED